MMYVIGLNAFVFILYYLPNGANVVSGLLFNRTAFLSGQIWRIVTFLFIPPTFSPIFVIFTLYFYYMIGRAVESEWGRMKFTVYYVFSALLTIIVCFVFDVSLDAMYINFSLFMAFATFYPDFEILLFFILPVKIKYLAYFDAAFFVYNMITTPFPYMLAPVIAMGAYVLFFWDYYLRFFRSRRMRNSNIVRFKQSVRKSARSQGYIHKCSVCGVTDADNPNEEFRYCSLCSDYACYCSKHIFNHEHR
jgi:hypothetical protein